MNELKPCPCGKTPKMLITRESADGYKWAYVFSDCCNEWEIEFRRDYAELNSDECMRRAKEAWNNASRG